MANDPVLIAYVVHRRRSGKGVMIGGSWLKRSDTSVFDDYGPSAGLSCKTTLF